MASTGYRALRLGAALAMLAVLGLSGCATLSEEECLTADWHAIGYEDGLNGQPANRIGKHREACADHGVGVDLAAYNAGRAEGLKTYCQPHNGYRLGLRGASYKGVCPADMADEFVYAYNYGRQIYDVQSDVNSESREIDRLHDAYHQIDDDILQMETLLVSPGLTPEERIALLADIKHLNDEQRDIEADIAYRQQRLDEMEGHLNDLRARSPY